MITSFCPSKARERSKRQCERLNERLCFHSGKFQICTKVDLVSTPPHKYIELNSNIIGFHI